MAYCHDNLNLIMRKRNWLFSPNILFRLQIPPFVKARTVLEGTELENENKKEIKKVITVLEAKNLTL